MSESTPTYYYKNATEKLSMLVQKKFKNKSD